MRLIYINEIGIDYKKEKQYEFLFTNNLEIDMESWFTIPASISTETTLPDVDYIDTIGLLKDTDIDLDLVQNSDYFGMIDAVDGVISLGWEKFFVESVNDRLYFKFGESLDSISNKIKNRNYKLLLNELKNT